MIVKPPICDQIDDAPKLPKQAEPNYLKYTLHIQIYRNMLNKFHTKRQIKTKSENFGCNTFLYKKITNEHLTIYKDPVPDNKHF